MTEQHNTDASFSTLDTGDTGNLGSGGRRRRFQIGKPHWTVVAGMIVGASFTGGYLLNSYFYCIAQFSCRVSPFWTIVLALIGASVGAMFGWAVGKFFRFFYDMTRVD
ncbi:MAG: hypothetical protein IIC92_09420 [Chloroflexi bacterium]|nr:hypothetical protein [Chloroflexota bacterium]